LKDEIIRQMHHVAGWGAKFANSFRDSNRSIAVAEMNVVPFCGGRPRHAHSRLSEPPCGSAASTALETVGIGMPRPEGTIAH
jgi:hypothetical protein